MSINYFYTITPRQFFNILAGSKKKEYENYKNGWEQTRLIIYYNYALQSDKKNRVKINKLLPFPWENQTEKKQVKKLTKKEIKTLFEKWDNIERK